MTAADRLLAVLAELDVEAEQLQNERDQWRDVADETAVNLAAARQQVAERDATIAVLEARIRELEAGQRATVFGADANGTSAAAQDRVVDKWGEGIAVRQFFTGFDQVAPRDDRVAVVHASWKPSSVTAITETAVRAATVNLKPGDCVEVWHESDKKVRDGRYTHTEALARKNRFYEVVKAVRPDLLVVNTLTGWEADPGNKTTGGNIDKWAEVKADLLGLDCDGVHGWPYPNYDGEIATAKAFVARFPGYSGWCVPEFGTSRNAANDADGKVRAAWAAEYAEKFADAKARYVCLYEYESTTGNAFTTEAELSAWRSLI